MVTEFYGYPLQAKEHLAADNGCGELVVAVYASSVTKPDATRENGVAMAERSPAADALRGCSARPVPGPADFFPSAWRMEASQA